MSVPEVAALGRSIDHYQAPLFLAWQINSECNLDCLHCCEEAGQEFPGRMSRRQMLDVCRQCAELDVSYVALSGGEPLLCEHLWEMCELLRSNGVAVKIETNGEAIDGETADRLAALRLRSLQVSLDGAGAGTHEALRERGDFDRVVEAVKLLREREVNVEIVFVPTRFNIHEAAEAVDLAESLGASGFYTGKLMRIGRAARNWDRLCPSDVQYEAFFETLGRKTEQYDGRMKVYFYPFDVVEEVAYRLDHPAASMLVLPNGKVKLIGPLPFLCGDLKVQPLQQVWENYKRCWERERVRRFAGRLIEDHSLLEQANDWVELY